MSNLNTEEQFEQGREAGWAAMRDHVAQQDDLETGKTAIESSQGYREMVSAIPVPRQPEGLDIEENREQVLRDAADNLTKQRGEDRPGEKPITERTYTEVGSGRAKDPRETLSIQQASSDLTGAREREQTAADQTEEAELARLIDEMRSGDVSPEQFQPQPVEQQQQPQVQEQPQVVDDDWQRHLQDPRVLNAIQQHTEQVNAQANQTIAAYNSAAINAANNALTGLVVAYPELQGVSAQQLPVVIQTVARSSPARAQDIVSAIGMVTDTVARGAEASRSQAQQQFVQYRKQFNSWASTQDAHYESYARQVPAAERQAIEEEARRMVLEESDPQSIAISWQTSQELRSAQAQRLLFDAARWRLAEKSRQSAQKKIRHAVPHVVRPGSPVERQPDSNLYLQKLEKPGQPLTAKEAAAFVTARRNSARR